MIIEFKNCGFHGYIDQLLMNEINKCREEHMEIFSKAPCPLELRTSMDVWDLWEYYVEPQVVLTKKQLHEDFCNYLLENRSAPFHSMHDGHKGDDNKLHITKLSINLNLDSLNELIVENIDNLDAVIENIKLLVRHEMGHIIDYIGFHLMDYDKFLDEMKYRSEELGEFFSSIDGSCKLDNIYRYYQMPGELSANNNVGISLDEMVESNRKLAINHKTLKTTLTIDAKHEPSEEDKNAN